MISRNINYYRLKAGMTKNALAEACGISPMAITYYERGERKPGVEVLKRLASALNVNLSDFLLPRNANLDIRHGEFRKNSSLTKKDEALIKESIEEYLNRLYSVIESLGGDVLPDAPLSNTLKISGDAEMDAAALRAHLELSAHGPIGNLTHWLENLGIPVIALDIDNDGFSGINGSVGNRPYIAVNLNMTPERERSTISHELVHRMFIDCDASKERYADAVGGAFLFPKEDVLRELGIHRSGISKDMELVCREYGITMYMLTKRASACGVISKNAETAFYSFAGKQGWKKAEPGRISYEEPSLFKQLVFRAVNEEEITISRGAELLRVPLESVRDAVYYTEG